MNRRFSLRSLLIVMSLVALFFTLRKYYVVGGPALGDAIMRAMQMPPLFAALAVGSSFFHLDGPRYKPSIVIGAICSTLVAAPLTIEIAEAIRRNDYWDWSKDWFFFLKVVGAFALVGALIGLLLARVNYDVRRLIKWHRARSVK
jgi:hypothetical protein